MSTQATTFGNTALSMQAMINAYQMSPLPHQHPLAQKENRKRKFETIKETLLDLKKENPSDAASIESLGKKWHKLYIHFNKKMKGSETVNSILATSLKEEVTDFSKTLRDRLNAHLEEHVPIISLAEKASIFFLSRFLSPVDKTALLDKRFRAENTAILERYEERLSFIDWDGVEEEINAQMAFAEEARIEEETALAFDQKQRVSQNSDDAEIKALSEEIRIKKPILVATFITVAQKIREGAYGARLYQALDSDSEVLFGSQSLFFLLSIEASKKGVLSNLECIEEVPPEKISSIQEVLSPLSAEDIESLFFEDLLSPKLSAIKELLNHEILSHIKMDSKKHLAFCNTFRCIHFLLEENLIPSLLSEIGEKEKLAQIFAEIIKEAETFHPELHGKAFEAFNSLFY